MDSLPIRKEQARDARSLLMCNRLTHDADLDAEFLIQTQRHIGSKIWATECREVQAPRSGTIAACIFSDNPVQEFLRHK